MLISRKCDAFFDRIVLSKQGKEAVIGILEPGQFFGEGCLNGHPLRHRDQGR